MPSRSGRQRRYLYWRFGSKWVHRHHFNKVVRKRTRKRKRGR